MVKEKFAITFFVEMEEKDAQKCAVEMNGYRHHMNAIRKWDSSQDLPVFTVEKLPPGVRPAEFQVRRREP